jgi:hypothetical protein
VRRKSNKLDCIKKHPPISGCFFIDTKTRVCLDSRRTKEDIMIIVLQTNPKIIPEIQGHLSGDQGRRIVFTSSPLEALGWPTYLATTDERHPIFVISGYFYEGTLFANYTADMFAALIKGVCPNAWVFAYTTAQLATDGIENLDGAIPKGEKSTLMDLGEDAFDALIEFLGLDFSGMTMPADVLAAVSWNWDLTPPAG